jgi:hypothetical protein
VLLPTLKRKYALLHFSCVTQWETFHRGLYTHKVLCHKDASLPKQFLFYSWFTYVNYGLVCMLIRGYINQVCGQTPIDMRMGTPVPTTNFDDFTLTET